MLILQNIGRPNPALAFGLLPWVLQGWPTILKLKEKKNTLKIQTTVIQPKKSIHTFANDRYLLTLNI